MSTLLPIAERNDFNITIGHGTGVRDNPSCIERINPDDVTNNRVDVTCPTVMRGRYVGFFRSKNGTNRFSATLCEVVVMGIRIIGNELKYTRQVPSFLMNIRKVHYFPQYMFIYLINSFGLCTRCNIPSF